jgi:hypothetical protein
MLNDDVDLSGLIAEVLRLVEPQFSDIYHTR